MDIISSKQVQYFDDSEVFGSKDGFFMAAALTHYDSNPEIVESPEYGELLIEHYGWGNSHLGYEYGSVPLANRYCTDEDLGYVRTDKTTIYPVFADSQGEVNTYRKKFKCIDAEHQRIWGEYDSAMAMQLAVKFHMCKGHSYCKSEREIRDYLSGKYIVLLYN